MVEILADLARIDLAISSANLITVEDCVPGAGVNSNSVTIGPCLTSVIFPFTLKSDNTLLNIAVLISVLFLFSMSKDGFFFGFSNKSREGNLKLRFVLGEGLFLLLSEEKLVLVVVFFFRISLKFNCFVSLRL